MSDDTVLEFTRHIAATPAKVWRCWTEPDLVRQWFAPPPFTVPEAEIDPRPGGLFRVVMDVPDHGRINNAPGCILVAEEARRFAWTNALRPGFVPATLGTDPVDFAFTAIIVMAPDGDGCTYHVRVLHATPDTARRHAEMGFFEGWGTCAAQLGTLAATL